MSLLLDSYRRNAEAARLRAETSLLPKVREQAEAAAEKWTDMVEKLDWLERQHKLREAAIVPRTFTTFD